MAPKLFTVAEVATISRESRGSIYRAIRQGRLEARRLGGGMGPVRITPAALVQFIGPWEPPARLPSDHKRRIP